MPLAPMGNWPATHPCPICPSFWASRPQVIKPGKAGMGDSGPRHGWNSVETFQNIFMKWILIGLGWEPGISRNYSTRVYGPKIS